MKTVKAHIGDLFRVTNAPDGHVFGDGVTVPAGTGGTPFEDNAGGVHDTTATGLKRAPDGTETAATLTHDGTGIYYFDMALTTDGKWFGRIKGTGTVTAAQEICIDVARSAFDAP